MMLIFSISNGAFGVVKLRGACVLLGGAFGIEELRGSGIIRTMEILAASSWLCPSPVVPRPTLSSTGKLLAVQIPGVYPESGTLGKRPSGLCFKKFFR